MPAESVSHAGTVARQNRIRQRSPLRQTTANLQGLLSLCSIKLTHVCTQHMKLSAHYNIHNYSVTTGGLSLMKLYHYFSPSATLSSNTVIFSSSSSLFFKNLTKTPLVKSLELSSKASASWHLNSKKEERVILVYRTENRRMSCVTADSKHVRGVAKDNVGCNSQDDVWSTLIMNIPGGEGFLDDFLIQ